MGLFSSGISSRPNLPKTPGLPASVRAFESRLAAEKQERREREEVEEFKRGWVDGVRIGGGKVVLDYLTSKKVSSDGSSDYTGGSIDAGILVKHGVMTQGEHDAILAELTPPPLPESLSPAAPSNSCDGKRPTPQPGT